MIEFFAKYWPEALFTLILSAITFLIKHHFKLMKDNQTAHENALVDKINQELNNHKVEVQKEMTECYTKIIQIVDKRDSILLDEDKGIRNDIRTVKEDLNSVRNGMLTVQGRAFKDECHRLLEVDHVISLVEYENILTEHATYNALGGNHEGDSLFHMVEAKYKNSLI